MVAPPFGRVCEHGRSACHSWACYTEEYGETKEEHYDYDLEVELEEEEEEES